MKKLYGLKKDLPTFKAGMLFELSKQGNLILRGECISDCEVVYSAQTLQKFPNILRDWFEEIPEEPRTVDDLKYGDKFYSISSDGFITTETYQLDKQYDDDMRIALGNAFMTKDDANREIARRKAKTILLRDTKGFKQDVGNYFYYVYYNYGSRELRIDYHTGNNLYDHLAFDTKEDALASIRAHEKEWKAYLGVEE